MVKRVSCFLAEVAIMSVLCGFFQFIIGLCERQFALVKGRGGGGGGENVKKKWAIEPGKKKNLLVEKF